MIKMRQQQLPVIASDPLDLICSLLRGEDSTLLKQTEFSDQFLSAARYHGVTALLSEKCRLEWRKTIRESLRQEAVAQAMWELRHRHVLAELLERMSHFAVTPILFKGTALAYDLYSSPVWRTRGDTDLLVDHGSLERCRQVLADYGFRRDFAIPGEFVSSEENWSVDGHAIDLHRKINNSALLAQLFSFEELRAASQPLPKLSPHAVRAGDVHALLIACMHRATHRNAPYYVDGTAHYGGDRLIWLLDIHLLTKRFSETQWEEFVSLARAKGLCATSREALTTTQAYLGSNVPTSVLSDLAQAGEEKRPDAYLRAGSLGQSWMDFLALDGFATKSAFLKEVLIPPKKYMLAKYHGSNRPLAFLYLHRAFAGFIGRVLPRGK